jgi:phenylalanyl-tRNA synthetase beta chain
MKISEQWLREWVAPKLDTAALAQRLTMAGLEVGAVEPVAPDLRGVVVGEIRAIAPHPAADKLRVCRVNAGKGKELEIVCGAANAAVGVKAPLALPGAKLPNGTDIKATEIRGVASAGMLCSAAELGIEESSPGLLALDADARPGQRLVEYLGLDDKTLEVDLTPNRGDCLSIAGVAREVGALTGARLMQPAIRNVPARSKRGVKVVLRAPKDCPRYVGRVIEDVRTDAVTPMWMRERLRRSGVRCIHPVVDVTNYVMLELGQPMHAFDLDRLTGPVQVRSAKAGESLQLLDGKEYRFEVGTLLIADAAGPLAMAGVMGGQPSAVTAESRHIFLESAWFHPDAIAGRARSLGLQTDASQRFERGVDPDLQRRAVERATALLLAIVGGRPGPVVEASVRAQLPKIPVVPLRAARIERLLGYRPSSAEVTATLRRLGMKVKAVGRDWRVTPPSHRFDIRREVDLIEEIARIHGYERLPSRRPQAVMRAVAQPESRVGVNRLRATLADRDYQEVVTYSFVDPAAAALFDPAIQPKKLANPIAADMAVMRTSLWPGLLKTVSYNLNRQQDRVRVFEVGRCFVPGAGRIDQRYRIAAAVVGSASTKQWGMAPRAADFFDLKGDLEALIAQTGRARAFRFEAGSHPALHPGQSARILRSGDPVGYIGVLHPEIMARIGMDRPVLVFELVLEALEGARTPTFREISRFPAVGRDLSLTLPEAVSARKILDTIEEVAGKLLVNLELFDEYRGKGVDSGRKSLAMTLTFQHSSRTLNEEEVDALKQTVVTTLESRYGAQLRR